MPPCVWLLLVCISSLCLIYYLCRYALAGLSHFSEKARWALDRAGVDYYEECHSPAMHLSTTLKALRNVKRVTTWKTGKENDMLFAELVRQRHDSKGLNRKETTAVPKLIVPASYMQEHGIALPSGGDADELFVVANGSSGILKFLSDVYPDTMGPLYPPGDLGKKVMALEHMLDVDLGDAAAKWCFGNLLLTGPSFLAETASPTDDTNLNAKSLETFLACIYDQDIPMVEQILFRLLGKRQLVPLMVRYNAVSSRDMSGAVAKIHEVFGLVDSLLPEHACGTSGRFLLGSSDLTAADVAFASLAVPVLLPPQTESLFGSLRLYDSFTTRDNAVGCSNIAALAKTLRKKYRSAQYALHIYENFRLQHSAGVREQAEHMPEMLRVADKYGEDSINFVCKQAALHKASTRKRDDAAAVLSPHLQQVYPRTKRYLKTISGQRGLLEKPHKSMNYRSCSQKYAHI